MKNNISNVTTTAVRTWLIFMCYDMNNRNCSVPSQLPSRKRIRISCADGRMLLHNIRFLTKYAVPHISVLNSYKIINL